MTNPMKPIGADAIVSFLQASNEPVTLGELCVRFHIQSVRSALRSGRIVEGERVVGQSPVVSLPK
jgi:hypothetical protein